jgi:hypothetical protein
VRSQSPHRSTLSTPTLLSPQFRIFVHPRAAPFGVESAFNGMGIFSARSLLDPRVATCRYTNESADYDEPRRRHVVSEHVPYHSCLTARGMRLAIEPSLLTYCHDWSTRHDARRTYYLANGSAMRLASRHAKPDPSWMPHGWLK